MKTISKTATALVGVIFLSGCTPQASSDEDIDFAVQPSLEDNGLHVNGLHVNGLHVNGLHVNGLHVNGTSLNGFTVAGMKLQGTLFTGTLNGAPVSGESFVGAHMTASLEGGGTLQLRIDTIESTSDPDIYLYNVSYLVPGSALWSPLCADASGQPVKSFPLSGYWDESEGTATGGDHLEIPNEFTFACEGYALAKCAEMGYKPWKSATECLAPGICHKVPLTLVHEACTRMMRADYCGDGRSTTRDGTLIDVADNLGFESPAAPAGWKFEAEWGIDGATCVEATRWPTLPSNGKPGRTLAVRTYIKNHCPARWAASASTCGKPQSSFFTGPGFATPLATRSLLTTRIPKH